MKTYEGFDRRGFIKVGLVAGTTLMVACNLTAGCSSKNSLRGNGKDSDFLPNAWIRISPDDTVTVVSKNSELGQGTTTGFCMIVAEELEADWSKIRSVMAPVKKEYINPEFGVMGTGGSTGLKTSWDVLRKAGAATREMLIKAAAETWEVPSSECRAENSCVIHIPSQRRWRYGQLLKKAALLSPPKNPLLKNPEEFRVIGRPLPRLDAGPKSHGKTEYGIDLKIPGLLTASIIHAPVIGSKAVSVDERTAGTMPGVRNIINMGSSVAVVADNYWQAKTAGDSLNIEWKGGHTDISTESIMSDLAGRIKEKGIRVRNDGDVKKAMRKAAYHIESIYELPFLAHACPEPINCTADVRSDQCNLWVPTQSQEVARDTAAHLTCLPLDAVRVHTPFVGGSFGRKASTEFVVEAVELSKVMKAPVKVVWSREENFLNGRFRPAAYNHIEAGLDRNGYPVAWIHKAVGQSEYEISIDEGVASILPKVLPSIIRYPLAGLIKPVAKRIMLPEKDMSGSFNMSYKIPNVRVEYIKADSPVPVGAWRSVADSRNAFVKESFMDEIAALTGKDPVDLRMHLLKETPRQKNVLALAADKAAWGKKLPDGVFRGVAFHQFHATPVAMVAEISIENTKQIRIHRIICAVDCGIAVNPALVKDQIRGSVAFALPSVLKGKINIKNGRIQESNFDNFPLLLYSEMPEVEVHIVKSNAGPTGIGEPGVPPVAPAVTNALFQATGKRIRSLPVSI